MPHAGGLYYEEHGSGQPLILSAGLGGSGNYWLPNLPALAERHRVILYDHRGTGRSDRALPATTSIEEMSADIVALLESPARHLFSGTHAARFAPMQTAPSKPAPPIGPDQERILTALDTERSADELVEITGLAPASLRSHLTLLEISKRVTRVGPRFARRAPA